METKLREELTSRLEIFIKNNDQHHGDYFRRFKSDIKLFKRKIEKNNSESKVLTTILGQIGQYPPTSDKKDLIALCDQAIELLVHSSRNKHIFKKKKLEKKDSYLLFTAGITKLEEQCLIFCVLLIYTR